MDIAIICTTLCVLALCGLIVWLSITARSERKELYDRIQSGTLRDYIVAEHERSGPGPDKLQGDGVPVDLDYNFEDSIMDEQTVEDLRRMEESFGIAMMVGEKSNE